MPLFKCSACGVIENTALGDYWTRQPLPLCSECAYGDWHGSFRKQTPEELGFIEGEDGFFYKPEELAKGGHFEHITRPKGTK